MTLIDTPGFDDTTKSDTDILRVISEYLASELVKELVILLLIISFNSQIQERQEAGWRHLFASDFGFPYGWHIHTKFQDLQAALWGYHPEECRHCDQYVG